MLKTSQVALFVVLGIVFWFTGMIMSRLLGPIAFTPGNPLAIVAYIFSFPLLFVSIWLASLVSRIAMKDMLEPVVIMTFAAVFLDGIVFGWLPQAYGDETGQVMHGAAWILWSGGAGLLCAWLLSRRSRTT
jgi:hypothetical protein